MCPPGPSNKLVLMNPTTPGHPKTSSRDPDTPLLFALVFGLGAWVTISLSSAGIVNFVIILFILPVACFGMIMSLDSRSSAKGWVFALNALAFVLTLLACLMPNWPTGR